MTKAKSLKEQITNWALFKLKLKSLTISSIAMHMGRLELIYTTDENVKW